MAAAGELQPDPAQIAVADRLDALAADLTEARPRGFFRRKASPPPQSLYIFGGVGRGKSLLMDMVFEAAPLPLEEKRRVHFHAFMQEVHAEAHRWRTMEPKDRARDGRYDKTAGDDPAPAIAGAVTGDARLLCFDEMQVTDIADAMILGRLFEAMLKRGVTFVATSNRPPKDLYKDGLNRQLFEPFIDMIETRFDVLELGGDLDYRRRCLEGRDAYYAPLTDAARAQMDAAWAQLTAGGRVAAETLLVQGRELVAHRTALGAARFHFDELAAAELGPGDYLALADRFHTFLVDEIPVMGPEKRNEAKRFVTFIDAIYEAHCNLVASAAAEPGALYRLGTGAFEFERTASRLAEMQTPAYRAQDHRISAGAASPAAAE
ncbi:MAG: cell division protein ZapE [Pseudomonadota bacterium]